MDSDQLRALELLAPNAVAEIEAMDPALSHDHFADLMEEPPGPCYRRRFGSPPRPVSGPIASDGFKDRGSL